MGNLSDQAQRALTELRRKTVLTGCTSFVQRKLQIGFNPAARIMDELESGGYISAADNKGMRRWPGSVLGIASGKEALLACPFCGSSNVDPEGWSMPQYAKTPEERAGPACDDCGATAPSIKVWNTRLASSGKGD